MTQDELLYLLSQGEGQRLELKRSLAELEDGVCTIAAFANAEAARCSSACAATAR